MLARFLRELFGPGTITVARAPLGAIDRDAIVAALADLDRIYRAESPGTPPTWSADVSLWAARFLYDACRALAHREIGADDVRAALSPPPPDHPSPTAHYSADLIFRALPDVVRLARGISATDPLSERLLAAAKAWPLSSVGIDVGPVDIGPFIDDRCLRRLYADRVIERHDASRLDDGRVVGEVRALLGAHPPPRELARRLTEITS